MTKIACISFPRSGHHALKNVLSAYFGDAFQYYDSYLPMIVKREDSNFQKEHDLDLNIPVILGARYLIQVRNPIQAVQSWLDFDSRVAACPRNVEQAEWRGVFYKRLGFWREWYDKWVLAPLWPRLVVDYEDLIARPYEVCESVIQYMTEQHPKEATLKSALTQFPISARPERPPRWIEKA